MIKELIDGISYHNTAYEWTVIRQFARTRWLAPRNDD